MDSNPSGEDWKANRRMERVDAAKKFPSPEYGFVTLLILVLFATLSAYGLEAYIKGHLENRMVRREISSRQAIYAAEGGIEWAKVKLTEDPSFSGGEIMVGEGKVSVQVIIPSEEGEGYTVTSSAEYGVAKRKIEATIQKMSGHWMVTQYQELHQ